MRVCRYTYAIMYTACALVPLVLGMWQPPAVGGLVPQKAAYLFQSCSTTKVKPLKPEKKLSTTTRDSA